MWIRFGIAAEFDCLSPGAYVGEDVYVVVVEGDRGSERRMRYEDGAGTLVGGHKSSSTDDMTENSWWF